MSAYRPEPERFWEKVAKESDDTCWLWRARITTAGYGAFNRTGKVRVYAHRWSYEQVHGPIPSGLVIDHICHNRPCVNPSHLRAVTQEQNTQNHSGPTAANKSGYRGVYFESATRQWVAQVKSRSVGNYFERFDSIEAAAAAVVAARNRMFTHNDIDRPLAPTCADVAEATWARPEEVER